MNRRERRESILRENERTTAEKKIIRKGENCLVLVTIGLEREREIG